MNISEKLSQIVGAVSNENGKAAEHAAPSAVDLLKADHRHVEQLFASVLGDDASAMGKHKVTIREICDALDLHTKIEEKLLYPAVHQKSKKNSTERDDVNEAVEEHAGAKDLIRKVRRTETRDETLKAKLTVLKEMIEHHVKEEESSFFPEAEKLLGSERLHAIGAQIEKMKARAAGSPARKKRRAAATARASKKSTAKRR